MIKVLNKKFNTGTLILLTIVIHMKLTFNLTMNFTVTSSNTNVKTIIRLAITTMLIITEVSRGK